MAQRSQPSSERLLERLREESLQLQRRSFDSADAGISANLCDEAIDRIAELEANEAAYEATLGKRTYNEVAEHIKYLEARDALLDRCSAKVDCICRGEAMKQKDGS